MLAGAIFGDHTSPLSDTTILSAMGSGIQLIDHTTTQIPYALVCAVASLVGFIVLGFTTNIAVGLLTTLAALAVAVFVLRAKLPARPSVTLTRGEGGGWRCSTGTSSSPQTSIETYGRGRGLPFRPTLRGGVPLTFIL